MEQKQSSGADGRKKRRNEERKRAVLADVPLMFTYFKSIDVSGVPNAVSNITDIPRKLSRLLQTPKLNSIQCYLYSAFNN